MINLVGYLKGRRRIGTLVAALVVGLGVTVGALVLSRTSGSDQARAGKDTSMSTLAVVRGKEGVSADVYVVKADGSNPKRLTRGPGFKYDPDWSPDGRSLLYRYEPPGPTSKRPRPLGLVVMRADGTGAVDLAKRAGVYSGPASWAPTGDRIAFSGGHPGEQSSIYVIDRDGSHLERLTPADREAQYPAWSPDGRRIAFTYVALDGGGFEVYVMDSSGFHVRRLTNGPEDNWPAWSSDSKQIAFSRRDSIWVMDADGSRAREVTRRGGAPLNWSPAPNLVFACTQSDNTIGTCSIAPDGTGLKTLLGGSEGGFPAWRPPLK